MGLDKYGLEMVEAAGIEPAVSQETDVPLSAQYRTHNRFSVSKCLPILRVVLSVGGKSVAFSRCVLRYVRQEDRNAKNFRKLRLQGSSTMDAAERFLRYRRSNNDRLCPPRIR